MTRRLLGPISGPVVFVFVAALVFAGLGWVTYSALRVENAQREAAAREELGNKLRVALWQLDSRMLPALGVEDSRPYYHYAPPDPASTPLFVAGLPEWMKLHFQLDPQTGWSSPLVLDSARKLYVCAAWADVSPRNMTNERSRVLAELKTHFPARRTLDLFAATERSIPADSLSLAAPLVAGEVQAEAIPPAFSQAPGVPPTALNPPPLPGPPSTGKPTPAGLDSRGDVIRVLGLELCLREHPHTQASIPPTTPVQLENGPGNTNEPVQSATKSSGAQSQALAPGGLAGRLTQMPRNGKQVAEWRNRAELIDRAIRDAKNASEYQMPRGQVGNYAPNALQAFEQKNGPLTSGPSADDKKQSYPPTPSGPPGPGGAPANPPGVPQIPGGPRGTPKDNAGVSERPSRETAYLPPQVRLAHELSTWFARPNATRTPKVLDEWANPGRPVSPVAGDGKGGSTLPPDSGPPPPPGDRVPELPAPALAPQPAAIHLGSMRPQWISAPDGTDMLVLVRAARVDGRTVYQGIVVDWPKLEEELKSIVREDFPGARLVPVKDSSLVSPDRAMTALPVQIDPGPQPEPAPAGWTPLRLGLVLAWLAAIIAFAAVGFAGWSLLDLAERRIRFVSAVTHELRTPLTSLRLYLDLLVSGMVEDEEKRREYLGTLAIESDRLHRLIDNVLDFAKLEKRKQNGDSKPVKLSEILDQLRQTWTDRVTHDGKELIVISTLPAEREVETNAGMIQQIVGNLIDNARKYTREAADSRIWVRATPGAGNGVVLEVEDRGPGVPANERKSIFKPFRRGEQADTRAGGAGLGLALAKSWAEVLGATLTYHPGNGGTGACFRLELPGK